MIGHSNCANLNQYWQYWFKLVQYSQPDNSESATRVSKIMQNQCCNNLCADNLQLQMGLPPPPESDLSRQNYLVFMILLMAFVADMVMMNASCDSSCKHFWVGFGTSLRQVQPRLIPIHAILTTLRLSIQTMSSSFNQLWSLCMVNTNIPVALSQQQLILLAVPFKGPIKRDHQLVHFNRPVDFNQSATTSNRPATKPPKRTMFLVLPTSIPLLLLAEVRQHKTPQAHPCTLGSPLVALLTAGPQDINKQGKISGSSFLMPQHQPVFLQILYWTSGVSNNLEDSLQDIAPMWRIVQLTAIQYTNSSLTVDTMFPRNCLALQLALRAVNMGIGIHYVMTLDSDQRNSAESSLALAQAGCDSDYFNHPAFLHILDLLYFTQSLEHYMGIVNLNASTSDWVPLTHITNATVANIAVLDK
ncbi:hypothetical protein SERLADRAFT_404581 [Serpula lacrymans var. lacrymans S7.9]|uniref:Uncharacterized protein n=1 Tax=Serpula lacrymans var. lacrymans (strain S7.9) TaxID=578457 RepID=F8NDS2_SERL9|nr:uncharacterized protein SERLADRAFT_404581 [Serpula lacrymans var. lacrymans S7.9]EGO30396.1 hypothetical protein SERLADRAFT_404581 [Serpula lacrymans var. lacrymans S7.9]